MISIFFNFIFNNRSFCMLSDFNIRVHFPKFFHRSILFINFFFKLFNHFSATFHILRFRFVLPVTFFYLFLFSYNNCVGYFSVFQLFSTYLHQLPKNKVIFTQIKSILRKIVKKYRKMKKKLKEGVGIMVFGLLDPFSWTTILNILLPKGCYFVF